MSQDAQRIDPSVVAGAKPAPFPGFVEPCHPTLRKEAPSGGRWAHEIKFDGYRTRRTACHLHTAGPRLDAPLPTDRRCACGPLGAGPDPGRRSRGGGFARHPDFGLLHADLAAGRQDRLLYYAFDLLYLDGFDLRAARLAERCCAKPFSKDCARIGNYRLHARVPARSSVRRTTNLALACPARTSYNYFRMRCRLLKKNSPTYWKKVWKRALAYLGRRPLKLVRHVRGTTFYHTGELPPVPETVHKLTIENREGGEGTRLWVDDLAALPVSSLADARTSTWARGALRIASERARQLGSAAP